MLGGSPADSLVVVPLGPNGLGEIVSIPLPRWDDSLATKRVATTVAGMVTKDASIDMVLVAVFTNQAAGGANDRPFAGLLSTVVKRLHDKGIHLAEAYFVAANGWGSFCDGPKDPLYGPRDLAELSDRAAVLEGDDDDDLYDYDYDADFEDAFDD